MSEKRSAKTMDIIFAFIAAGLMLAGFTGCDNRTSLLPQQSATPRGGNVISRYDLQTATPIGGNVINRDNLTTPTPVGGNMLNRYNLQSASPIGGDMLNRNNLLSPTPVGGNVIARDNILGLNGNLTQIQSGKTDNVSINLTTDTKRADTICSKVKTLSEVKDANVLIVGNNCIVGVVPKDTGLAPAKLQSLVASKVKAVDKDINDCNVSTMPDVRNRIMQLSRNLNGITINQINTEFNRIMGMIKSR